MATGWAGQPRPLFYITGVETADNRCRLVFELHHGDWSEAKELVEQLISDLTIDGWIDAPRGAEETDTKTPDELTLTGSGRNGDFTREDWIAIFEPIERAGDVLPNYVAIGQRVRRKPKYVKKKWNQYKNGELGNIKGNDSIP